MTDHRGAQGAPERPSGLFQHRKIKAPCCGPFAVHVCTGLPYGVVMATMASLLGKRSDWAGRTMVADLLRTFDALSVPYKRVPEIHGLTVLEAAWPRNSVNRQLPLLLSIPGHYVTLHKSQLTDQVQSRHVLHHDCRFRLVKEAYQILKQPTYEEELI